MQQNASITTQSIELQVVRLGSKQMTLAVFRQLPLKPVLTPDGILLGNVWGRVNYFWGACANDHLHIIWQEYENDTQLFRSCVWHKPWGNRTSPHYLTLDVTEREQAKQLLDESNSPGYVFDRIVKAEMEYYKSGQHHLVTTYATRRISVSTHQETAEEEMHRYELFPELDRYELNYDSILTSDQLFIAV